MALKVPKGYIKEDDPRVVAFGHPAPAWLFPYSDLMTELVAFFIILYAFSASLNPDVQEAKAEVEQMMAEEEIAGDVKIDREGMKITLEEYGQAGYFESGYADLTPKMTTLLDRIAPLLRKLVRKGHPLIIEGHTDDIPIKNDYFWGNWELSTARSTMVVEYLIDRKGFSPGCMGAVGYGEHRPIAPNDSVANRRRNRRVVFFVKSAAQGKLPNCIDQTKPKTAKSAEAVKT